MVHRPSGRERLRPLKPKLVVEVAYDHLTDNRFRHGTKLLRWRPDKAPRQCTFDQLPRRSGLVLRLGYPGEQKALPSTAASLDDRYPLQPSPSADDGDEPNGKAKLKLALEVLVLPPLRAAAVGTIVPLPLPLLGSLTSVLRLHPNLGGPFARPLVRFTRRASSTLGAALAYYSVFSMGPLLLIVTSVAGLFFGADAVRGSLTAQFRSLLGEAGSKAVEAMLAGASSEQSGRLSSSPSRTTCTGALRTPPERTIHSGPFTCNVKSPVILLSFETADRAQEGRLFSGLKWRRARPNPCS